jgi:hypothetical protein
VIQCAEILGKALRRTLDSVRGKDTEVALCDFVVTPIGPVSYAGRHTDCVTSSEIKKLLLAVNAVEFEHSTLAASTPTKINWDNMFFGIIWPCVLN